MNAPCERCTAGPTGETGHEALAFYVVGPYPGHNIFNCTICGERWIRHCGLVERYGWTRYSTQFQIRRPRTQQPVPRVTPF
jgi:hypothetical protein